MWQYGPASLEGQMIFCWRTFWNAYRPSLSPFCRGDACVCRVCSFCLCLSPLTIWLLPSFRLPCSRRQRGAEERAVPHAPLAACSNPHQRKYRLRSQKENVLNMITNSSRQVEIVPLCFDPSDSSDSLSCMLSGISKPLLMTTGLLCLFDLLGTFRENGSLQRKSKLV